MEQVTRDYCRTLIEGRPCAFCGTNSCSIGNSPRHCYDVEQARQKAKESQATLNNRECAQNSTQHTQAKMPSFEEMRKSCIERGICSEDGFYTNHFDTGFKAAYNCIARHFGCA